MFNLSAEDQQRFQGLLALGVCYTTPAFQCAYEDGSDPNHAWAIRVTEFLRVTMEDATSYAQEAVDRFGAEALQVDPQQLIARYLMGASK